MNKTSNLQMIRKLMFRLLPVQILLAIVGSVDELISSYFASNYVGMHAMGATGLYGPIAMFNGAVSMMVVGGCVILTGKLLGQNEKEKMQDIFSLNLLISLVFGVVGTVIIGAMGLFDLTGLFTADEVLRPVFNRYLIGQAVGMIPLIIGNQLPAFLSIENQSRRTLYSSLVYIAVNLVLDYIFIILMHMEVIGLSLASSLGSWVFMLMQAHYFMQSKSMLKLKISRPAIDKIDDIIRIGLPGAATNLYMTLRGMAVNKLLEIHVGSVGISAFAAASNVLNIFLAIPAGMLTVSRLLISVSVGEEDRRTLTDIFRVMFRYYIPLMVIVDVGIILMASPLAMIFFKDTSSDVFVMMADALRILPLCMPFTIIVNHFTCYGQVSGKQIFVNVISLLDGVLCVVGFSLILCPLFKSNGVCMAGVLNGIVTVGYIITYSWYKNRHMPINMEQLMLIPDSFGVPDDERIDVSVTTIDEVVNVSRKIQTFCQEKGIDQRRAYLAGLSMEEMAGNVVDHGFTKDNKKHTVDIRVVHKDNRVILRIKDDCIPFNPEERIKITSGNDPLKNIGIRMIYSIMHDISYQNIFGLNVLTIKI